MSEKPITNEDVEKYLGEVPRGIVARLPECPQRRAAETHLRQAEALAHEALEKWRPE